MKLDVSIDMPFELDLSCVRGHGLQPNEVQLPEEPKPGKRQRPAYYSYCNY